MFLCDKQVYNILQVFKIVFVGKPANPLHFN